MNDQEQLIRYQSDTSLEAWREKEKIAIEILGIVGDLRFDKSIELILFRRDIYDARPSEVLNDHRFATNYINQPISVNISLEICKAIAAIDNLGPSRIDIGRLGAEWLQEKDKHTNLTTFINGKLANNIGASSNGKEMEGRDVVLYGFGRIGRLVARRIIDNTGKGEQLRLKAIVLRPKMSDRFEESSKRAALMRKDTVHGKFRGIISVSKDGNELVINGNPVKLIYAKAPSDIDYTEYGIKNAILIDNTGVWRDKDALSVHLRPGVSKVMLTAPGKEIPNIVYGVNHKTLDLENDDVLCAASCTTNAIVPVIKVVDDHFGIAKGHIETIHSYTSDQNLLDNFHKKARRGRGAATNMVLTTTGAAAAVSKVIPHLKGVLTGNAVRVPTPNVSLAIMNLTLKKSTSIEEINSLLKKASLHGDLVEQIQYSTSIDYVSSQAVGKTHASVYDAPSTKISNDGLSVTLYAWYDNEYGYTCQVVRLAKYVAEVRRFVYY